MIITSASANRKHAIFFALFFCAVWIGTHSYQGIWHDGKLYLGQALFRLYPDIFRHDLFFKYGSQDQFTVFSSLYAWTIDSLGLGTAPFILMVIGQCLFIVALLLCCVALFGNKLGIWAALAVAAVARYYGGGEIISYSETFVTARNFAEPLCLFGIWLVLIRRWWWALAALIGAALFHPLTTLPCMLIWWLSLASQNRRWFYLGLVAFALPVLGAMQIAPFDRLLQSYDETWWGMITRNPFIIPTDWRVKDWIAVVFDMSLLWFGSRFIAEQRIRHFMRVVIVVAVVCELMAVMATSLFQNVLLTGLQLWRVQWVLHLLAICTIPVAVYSLWNLRGTARLSAIFLAIAGYLNPYPGALGAVLLAAWLYHEHKKATPLSRPITIFLWVAAGAMVLMKAGVGLIILLRPDPQLAFISSYTGPSLRNILLALPLYWVGWGLCLWLYFGLQRRGLAYCAAIAMIAYAIVLWDQRDPWKKYLEQDHAEPHPFKQHLKPNGEVFWYGEVLAPWILLKTPSYLEDSQGGGLLFNRGTAMAFSERTKALTVLRFQTEICAIADFLNDDKGCEPSNDVVKEACEVSKELDAMILPWKIPDTERVKWTISLPESKRETTFYLYKCDNFRR
jgi:hypothetical protein